MNTNSGDNGQDENSEEKIFSTALRLSPGSERAAYSDGLVLRTRPCDGASRVFSPPARIWPISWSDLPAALSITTGRHAT